MENTKDLIVLTGDDGEEFEVEVVSRVEVGDNEYFIVKPSEEEDVYTALRVDTDEEGNEVFTSISDEEMDEVEEAFNIQMLDEEE